MNRLLLTAILFLTTTLSLTAPPHTTTTTTMIRASNSTLQPRYDHPRTGEPTGIEIHVYPRAECKGWSVGWHANYTTKMPYQTVSYRLSRGLYHEERMDFWNAEEDGGPVDTAYNGNMKACTYRIREAHDDEIKKVDCYTLGDPVGCLRVYMPSPGDTARQGYGTGM